MGEADRFSLEALRHIHKQLDDDNDGGIEVNESVEVSADANHDMVTSPLTKPLMGRGGGQSANMHLYKYKMGYIYMGLQNRAQCNQTIF